MNLVVDASVAIKWFFFEELRAEALALIDLPTELLAPDLFRAEFTNVLWKKIRRREVSADNAALLIEQIDAFITFAPSNAETIQIALKYAVQLDHPLYDCVYLSLAEQLGTKFVTADRRFVEKATAAGLDHLVAELGRPLAPPLELLITDSDLDRLVALAKRFDETVAYVYQELAAVSPTRFVNVRALQPAWDSPAYRRLLDALSSLSEMELKELAALAWLGRGFDGRDFASLKRHAEMTFGDGAIHHLPYIISLLRYVEGGLASLNARDGGRKL